MPIDIPAFSLADLNRMTSNFGQKSLIGEGSYGRVFYALLPNEVPIAIKKLDPNASQELDSDFQAQVTHLSHDSSVKLHFVPHSD